MSTFWDDLVSAMATEGAATAGIAQSWTNQPGQVGAGMLNLATKGVQDVERNLAALAVGIGLFGLGALMIAFSAFDDIADLLRTLAKDAGEGAATSAGYGAAAGKRAPIAAAAESAAVL